MAFKGWCKTNESVAAAQIKKMSWNCGSNKDKHKNNGKMSIETWSPSQYMKRWVFKFRLRTCIPTLKRRLQFTAKYIDMEK